MTLEFNLLIPNNSYVFTTNTGSSFFIPFLNSNAKYIIWDYDKKIFKKNFYNYHYEILKNPKSNKFIIFRVNDYEDFYIDLLKEIKQYVYMQSYDFKIINCHDFQIKFFDIHHYEDYFICEIKNKKI